MGVFNTLLDFTILNILAFALHVPVLLANTISVCVGVTVSYYLNHYFVFRHHKAPSLQSFVKFFVITGLSAILLQNLIITITTPLYLHIISGFAGVVNNSVLINYSHQIATNLAKATAVIVGMFWNYFFYSKTVFNSTDKLPEE